MTGFCRDCLADAAPDALRCPQCGSPRLVHHAEIDTLSIAHVDCDAFYATIEKRDDSGLRDKPVIVGGSRRGVVAAACYIARTFGVRSAMPMFQARRLCPQAVVIPPDMAKYASVGREVRRLMLELTPLVEPLSIDEAFLDLAGTTRLHRLSPGKSLARFAMRVETSIGITVSIGLSANKFLAKIASDLGKPRGYAVLGVADGRALLAPKPVNFIWGVGRATAARLARNGITTVGDLAAADERELARRYGSEGLRLARLARAIDTRSVMPDREARSVSAETTFHHDLADFRALERQLWPLCERVSTRLKAIDRAGSSVTLKLKTADFRLRGRTLVLSDPTQLAGRIFAAGRALLTRETDGTRFRLIGIGVGQLVEGDKADPPDLVDDKAGRAAAAEHALDRLRQKFGHDSVIRGLAFDPDCDG